MRLLEKAAMVKIVARSPWARPAHSLPVVSHLSLVLMGRTDAGCYRKKAAQRTLEGSQIRPLDSVMGYVVYEVEEG